MNSVLGIGGGLIWLIFIVGMTTIVIHSHFFIDRGDE